MDLKTPELTYSTQQTQQDDYDFAQSRDDYVRAMRNEGFRIVLPADNELQIDIDTEEQYAVFERSFGCMVRNWAQFRVARGVEGGPTVKVAPSRSGLPSRHITITLPWSLSPWERIALQAALGSDPVRELLSALRLSSGMADPTMFVEASLLK